VVYAVVFVPLWLKDNKNTLDWKMAYTVIAVTMGVVNCVCWWLLMRKPKRKESDNMEQQT